MTTTTYDPFKLVKNEELPPIPEDNKCQHCLVNELQYRWKREKYVCKYCWTRLDDVKYSEYTDEQLDDLRAKTLQELKTSKNEVRSIVNTRIMGAS